MLYSLWIQFILVDRQDGPAPILPRGIHHFPFKFQLPQSSLPCSFESKPGYVRYYIKVNITLCASYTSRAHNNLFSFLSSLHLHRTRRIFSGDSWHTVRIATPRNEILHHHRTAHRLHGRSIFGERTMNN